MASVAPCYFRFPNWAPAFAGEGKEGDE